MRTRTLAAVVAIALLAGCPRRPTIRPDAFDKGQKAALLLLEAQPKITIWAAPGTQPGPALEAAPVLAELRPIVLEAMAKNPHFELVPEAKVLGTASYKAHAETPDPTGYVSAPGYKAVTDERLYPKLAKEAGAEMGLGMRLNLAYRAEDGAAAVVVAVGAIDLKGRGIWKGGSSAVSDSGVDVRTASPRQRIDAFKGAARDAMEQLQESMTAQLSMEGAQLRTEH